MKASNLAKQLRIEDLNQRITLLEQNNQVHRHDFELERQSREKAVGEKQQMLRDLRILQKRNQKLIEERQNQIDNYEKFLGNSMSSSSYINPIRVSNKFVFVCYSFALYQYIRIYALFFFFIAFSAFTDRTGR